MPNAKKQHRAVFAQALARRLLADGIQTDRVFAGTTFTSALLEQDEPMADFCDTARFFEHAAELTSNSLIGAELGLDEDIRIAGLLGYIGMAATSVGCFLRNFARYTRVFSEALDVDIDGLPTTGRFEWTYGIPPSVARRQYAEFSAASLVRTIRRQSGQLVGPRQVYFQHHRRTRVEELEAHFGCPVVFGAARNGCLWDLEDLERPLVSADMQLLKILKSAGDQILGEQRATKDSLIAQVETLIAEHLAQGSATLATVAHELGMSPRTLSRRLAEEDTTFFRLLERLRVTMAKTYLKDSDLVLAEIAFLLGYSGLSSFNEAFKRWTGSSPGQFRTQ